MCLCDLTTNSAQLPVTEWKSEVSLSFLVWPCFYVFLYSLVYSLFSSLALLCLFCWYSLVYSRIVLVHLYFYCVVIEDDECGAKARVTKPLN